jgi:hypothetical protein
MITNPDLGQPTQASITYSQETLLAQAQHLAWLRQHPTPATSHEALGRLLETTRLCLKSFEEEQLLTTQNTLEDVLIQTLIAMKSLSIQPDQALQRALERIQNTQAKRAFHIFTDRVEIRVQGETRGEWPLYSQHDYQQALNLARELDCDLIHEEACQLGLFNHARLNQIGRTKQASNSA